MHDIGDEIDVDSREEQLRIGRDRRTDGLSRLLKDPQTREWIWYILSQCGLYQTVTSTDPIDMAQRSGRRDVGLLILEEIILANPTAYSNMLKESANGDYK